MHPRICWVSFLFFLFLRCINVTMVTGLDRITNSSIPIESFLNVLPDQPSDVVFVTEPSLSESGTMKLVVSLLKQWGARRIFIVCAVGNTAAVNDLRAAYSDISVQVGAMDETIDDPAKRQFGTQLRPFTGGTINVAPRIEESIDAMKGTSLAPFRVVKVMFSVIFLTCSVIFFLSVGNRSC